MADDDKRQEQEPEQELRPYDFPPVSEKQRQEEAERLAAWSAYWHDHLEEVYAQAYFDIETLRIERIGTDEEQDFPEVTGTAKHQRWQKSQKSGHGREITDGPADPDSGDCHDEE